MISNSKVGVIICECGSKIKSLIDLELIQKEIEACRDTSFCKILPFTCLQAGIDELTQFIIEDKINRLIIGGCESRLILDKFEDLLRPLGLLKGQIEILNLRGHVGMSNKASVKERAKKSVKLIKAAVAEMKVLNPTPEKKIVIDKPVMLLGSGISIWPAAKELDRNNVNFLMQEEVFNEGFIYESLKSKFPGFEEFIHYFEETREEILASKYLTVVPKGDFISMSGETGNYELVFINSEGSHSVIKVGIIFSSFDCDLINQTSEFSYDGINVVIQNELMETIQNRGILEGNVVIWVNDYESNFHEFSEISINSAIQLAKLIINKYYGIKVTILFNEQMVLPLTINDSRLNLIKYNKYTKPIIQESFIVITDIQDRIIKNIPWNILALSPKRVVNSLDSKAGEILRLTKKDNGFLDTFNPNVLPNQLGGGGVYISGSSKYPCNFEEVLVFAHDLSRRISSMINKSKKGELLVPRIVCKVDEEKCVGCGLAQSICENSCFKVSAFGKVAKIDPMLCTGGGTCTASCPYNALDLQNSTTEQRETRIGILAKEIGSDSVIVAGCSWGGLASADNAGKKGIIYSSKAHIIGVPCVGQLDPRVLARAFLNGAAGLLLVGCYPNQCHHSYGVDHAWSRVNLIKKLLYMCNIDTRRISLAHADFNLPEEFSKIIDSFTNLISNIGSIEKNQDNINKLQSLYNLASKNVRVRHLVCTSLRSHAELDYLGNQKYSLEIDREFNRELSEEFIQERIVNLLSSNGRSLKAKEISKALKIENSFLSSSLLELNRQKLIKLDYKSHIPSYSIN